MKNFVLCLIIVSSLFVAAQDKRAMNRDDFGPQDMPLVGEPLPMDGVYTTMISIDGGEPVELTYLVEEGQAILDGDIILPQEIYNDLIDQSGKAAIRTVTSSRWNGAVVPYTIHANIGTSQRNDILSAIDSWEDNTPFRFVNRTSQSSYVIFANDSNPSQATCNSYVGRQGGAQTITVDPGCGVAATIHEIGHALGMWHEQARTDRDSYINIHWNNIESGMEHNFQTYVQRGQDGQNHGAYDTSSIMHYSSSAFSNGNGNTITTKSGATIPYNYNLTSGDINGAISLVQPKLTVQSDYCRGMATLSWNTVPGATSYKVYFSTYSSGTSRGVYTTTSNTQAYVNFNRNMYVWVKAIVAGKETDYSNLGIVRYYSPCL